MVDISDLSTLKAYLNSNNGNDDIDIDNDNVSDNLYNTHVKFVFWSVTTTMSRWPWDWTWTGDWVGYTIALYPYMEAGVKTLKIIITFFGMKEHVNPFAKLFHGPPLAEGPCRSGEFWEQDTVAEP